MNAPIERLVPNAAAPAPAAPGAWQRYLDDLKAHAAGPAPLELQGTLSELAKNLQVDSAE